MKTIILFSVLALIILAASSAPAPVLDAHGKSLRAGVKYLVKPADNDGYIGGFGLVEVLTKHCPAVVGQLLGKQKGLWLTFTPANPKERLIRLSTDVNIKFSGSNSCNESNVWQLKYNKALEQYGVMVGGVEGNPGPKTLNNWFKIEKTTSHKYKFVFCPSVCSNCKVMCGDITKGLQVFGQGIPLVFTKDTDSPFSPVFY
ncbi:putative proteinase inhibitor I3, Kunitz legume, kunitz inhibitor STI-like superfamily [Helianthus annuus]|uniref:Putative alpha-amylase/subtilisin inhibitor n=1 Tax=Helianthus annuus TaxID=4232 RepID=A0A251UER2_HELAN|nr:miraculin [Helianthus annuus]KAF5800677.1 putative proteinase inhibitor I3, Kunitz legume, kunitz inhibitor STI-like superfamily [Helianthus annuus]KAJ0559069.1 putative proteinase inhibitor I3, Kunitz legume, kunitz inhibitor STI-like superfamily [Helianthus annuus]KAJ0564946.1 putative proteinase inhibitor I3, Kunitz legume, kunitz inhibitor STI-like superfamily [Helianthus annuus]KAJ0572015.1 putative proteinase inhibitor I3, Kunitz legume, kunitz inhibitor STI-like superfamily [Helianthu